MGQGIGIDLGTTNTVVSYYDKNKKLKALKVNGNEIIPSALYFEEENRCIVGKKALNKGLTDPKGLVHNFKSKMGDKAHKFQVTAANGDKFRITAREAATHFLNQLYKEIEKTLIKEFGSEEGKINHVIITVPAKFSITEKEATKNSAIDAGFENVSLAYESTAAAVAYHTQSEKDEIKNILVYDFGGGTFDVSVLQEKNGTYREVVTPRGDKHLGGNKLTKYISDFIFERINEDYDSELPYSLEEFEEDGEITFEEYKHNYERIFNTAENIKISLSDEEEEEIEIMALKINSEEKNASWEGIYRRESLEKLIKKDILRTIQITGEIIEEARDEGIEINEIILAGGSSQIPLVKKYLEEEIGYKVQLAPNVSTLISNGAALLANMSSDVALINITKTNVDLGIAIKGDIFDTIIPIGVEQPVKKTEDYILFEDGQTSIEIQIYERDRVNYPKSVRTSDLNNGIEWIDTISIGNLPEGLKRNECKICVTFKLAIDGILEVDVEVVDNHGRIIETKNLIIKKDSNLM